MKNKYLCTAVMLASLTSSDVFSGNNLLSGEELSTFPTPSADACLRATMEDGATHDFAFRIEKDSPWKHKPNDYVEKKYQIEAFEYYTTPVKSNYDMKADTPEALLDWYKNKGNTYAQETARYSGVLDQVIIGGYITGYVVNISKSTFFNNIESWILGVLYDGDDPYFITGQHRINGVDYFASTVEKIQCPEV